VYRDEATSARRAEAEGAPSAVLLGDIGAPGPWHPALASAVATRLAAAPRVPLIVLGDVFYSAGLLGACRGVHAGLSSRGCAEPDSPEAQLEAVLGAYRNALPGSALLAIAGNHDHDGDPVATTNACRLIPAFAPGWRYLAEGCGLGAETPVATRSAGPLALLILDSERMLRDAAFRRASADALRRALERLRLERPDAWRVLLAHHPLESYGLHNGAHPLTALRKDLYPLLHGLLLPIVYPLDRWLLRGIGAQDLYDARYRAYRRALYAVLRDTPVDLFAAGHDHSLQLVAIEHPGLRAQLVVGAGAYVTPVKRFGLDLLGVNRLARAVGLRDRLPAVRHRLVFGAGPADAAHRSGHGFVALLADGEGLRVEFHDAASPEPLYVARLARQRGDSGAAQLRSPSR
jgi:hypothetical protein